MPYTVNGIGTHYYGKKNLERTVGVCEKCGGTGELLTYETRLWFVVLFIPIIPLGKKQIIDYCGKCSTHRAVSLREWRRVGDEAIQESMEEMSSDPDDPEAAMKMHARLDSFNKMEEAGALAEMMEAKFADNAEVQLYLAAWHDQKGRTEEADARFARVLEVDPENPHARRAVAFQCIRDGNLDRARELVAFMLEPDGDAEPGVLFTLAAAYQGEERHDDALEVFKAIVMHLPEAARKDKKLRRAVELSEEALAKQTSILPEPGFNWRKTAWVGAAAVVVIAAVGVNYYLKTNQKLYVVNRLRAPALVSIPGVAKATVRAHHIWPFRIGEGEYRVSVSVGRGPVQEIDVRIRNSLFQRLSRDNVFALNVGGSAVLVWEETTYLANPDPHGRNPHRLHVGEPFVTLRDIDYAFKAFPTSLKIERGRSATRTRVDIVKAEPSAMVDLLSRSNVEPAKLIAYAEAHLPYRRDDRELLNRYLGVCAAHDGVKRMLEFLSAGSDARPVAVEWHRAYQNAHRVSKDDQGLVDRYDAMLARTPNDSNLLYLRGRLEIRASTALPYYERSIQANVKNAYPLNAKGYALAARGDLTGARQACGQACKLAPDNASMAQLLFGIRLALGEYAELEREAGLALRRPSADMGALDHLMQVYVAQGEPDKARKALEDFLAALKKKMPQALEVLGPYARLKLAYLTGNLTEYVKLAQGLKDSPGKQEWLFQAHLSQFNMAEAEAAVAGPGQDPAGLTGLMLYIGWAVSGDDAKTKAWLGKALDGLKRGS